VQFITVRSTVFWSAATLRANQIMWSTRITSIRFGEEKRSVTKMRSLPCWYRVDTLIMHVANTAIPDYASCCCIPVSTAIYYHECKRNDTPHNVLNEHTDDNRMFYY